MTEKECEKLIFDFIEEQYQCEFRGKVTVVNTGEDLIKLELVLNMDFVPLGMFYQGTMEEFLEFVKKEIIKRRLYTVQYYSGYKNEREPNY